MLLRCAAALLASIGVVACSPTLDAGLENTSQSYNAATPAVDDVTGEETQTTAQLPADAPAAAPIPAAKPTAGAQETTATAADEPKPSATETAKAEVPPASDDAGDQQQIAALASGTAASPAETEAAKEAEAPQAKPAQSGFLAGFFNAGKKPKPIAGKTAFAAPEKPQQVAVLTPKPAVIPPPAPTQFVENPPAELSFENFAPQGEKLSRPGTQRSSARAVRASFADDGEGSGLPGVRQSALFEIKRKSGMDDDSDVDLHEDVDEGPIQLATAGGLARLSPNGLLRQRDSVDVACLKPSLVRVLKTIERHYGRQVIVTSGYRSPTYNRRVRGAKNSQHMYCAAADIQVQGVSKWELASFARGMTGRGGVGTYCHTNSVHVDVGPERDWNWRCRGRR